MAYRFQLRRCLPIPAAACLTYVAFLLGSKIVHVSYVFLLLPLLLWEHSERPSEAKAFLFRAAYALSFAFATIAAPLLVFLGPGHTRPGLCRFAPLRVQGLCKGGRA